MMTPGKILLAGALLVVAGCGKAASTQDDVGVSSDELSRLFAPEANAKASDYRAQTQTFRVLGTQAEGEERFVTLADTTSWETRNVAVGDLIARNLKVVAVDDAGATIDTAFGRVTVQIGQDLPLRQIRHRFDLAASYQGRLTWQVDSANLKALRAKHGIGATAAEQDVFPDPSIQLVTVDPKGVFAKLGLKEGDLLFTANGQKVAPDGLEALADQLQTAGTVTLTVYREGAVETLTYNVQ